MKKIIILIRMTAILLLFLVLFSVVFIGCPTPSATGGFPYLPGANDNEIPIPNADGGDGAGDDGTGGDGTGGGGTGEGR